MKSDALLLTGFLLGAALLPLVALLARLVHARVDEGEVVLVLRFGRLVARLERPGWHLVPDRVLPWVELARVSTRREYRVIQNIFVNDARGTTVVVDVFLEFRIVDPVKAVFAVADRERALTNLVSHSVTSSLGNCEFRDILADRTSLSATLAHDTAEETSRWGIRIERALLRNVALLPEISQQMIRSVAARLERWKADIEEDGRQRVALLEAQTTAQVSTLVAEARAQYPAAIGRAYGQLRAQPRVCAAYDELYELSLLHPHRTVAFVGFGEDELRPLDAAMLVGPPTDRLGHAGGDAA